MFFLFLFFALSSHFEGCRQSPVASVGLRKPSGPDQCIAQVRSFPNLQVSYPQISVSMCVPRTEPAWTLGRTCSLILMATSIFLGNLQQVKLTRREMKFGSLDLTRGMDQLHVFPVFLHP